MTTLEVLFTPADFAALQGRDLAQTVCVVFDVLRATSTMVAALANGAAAVVPVADIPEALALRRQQADVLLAGERDGVRIRAALTGGTDFDLGNSPREFTPEAVRGRIIVTTTTNGTRALRSCANASNVLISSFLNLGSTAEFVSALAPASLLLICSGTYEEAAYEDALAAGALCDLLWHRYAAGAVADSARMARQLFLAEHNDLLAALSQSRNGRRLLQQPALSEDVAYCARRDLYRMVAAMGPDGRITIRRNDSRARE